MSYTASLILVSIYLCCQWLRSGKNALYANTDAVPKVQGALDRFGLKLDMTMWLGHVPTRAERVRVCRALAELEAQGFLERIRSRRSGRTLRVRLTERGGIVAQQVLDTRSDELDTLLLPLWPGELEEYCREAEGMGGDAPGEDADGAVQTDEPFGRGR